MGSCFSLLQTNTDAAINALTIGQALLKSRSLQVNGNWYWISIGAIAGFSLFFNVCFIAALTYLSRKLCYLHNSDFILSE